MKKVTYQSKIYTVEEMFGVWYNLSGIGWVKKSECTHWLSGWFNQHFNNAAFNRLVIAIIFLLSTVILFRCII